MLVTLISAGVLAILLVGLSYEANKKEKEKKQKEEIERELGLEESVGTQHHECCGDCCGHYEEEHECCGGQCGGECECQHEIKEERVEHFVEVEEVVREEEMQIEEQEIEAEEQPVMLAMEELEEIVYINEGASSSKKYHNRPDAHNMDGAVAVPRSRADEQGFVPCGKCFKH